MPIRKVRNQLYARPFNRLRLRFPSGFSRILLITSLFLVSCTRDEVFSAVSTAVVEYQTTRTADQSLESSQLPSVTAVSETTDGLTALPSPTVTPQISSTPTRPPDTPTSTSTATLIPTFTPSPSLTPSPTPLADAIEQGEAELLLVAGGSFEMGTAAATLLAECNSFRSGCQESWFAASEPAHTLTLDPYYIDATEVTNTAYATFLNSLGSHERDCLGQRCLNLENSRLTLGDEGIYQIAEEEAAYPVTGVSWYGAAAFCTWRGGRLPTEAEWEMAAGWDAESVTKRLYPWGDSFDGTVANTCDASCEQPQANPNVNDGFVREAVVGSFEGGRSPAGAYDMGGNLWEWVADWYDAEYYKDETANPTGPAEGEDKVVRGGSWFDTGNFTATAIRFPSSPTNTDSSIGFRCAADVPVESEE